MSGAARAAGRGRPLARHPAWFAHVQVGDVLRSGRGTYRIAREVARRECGRLHSVTFTIRRPSWTRRPHTTLGASDFLTFGYTWVGVRIRLDTPLDVAIAEEIRRLDPPRLTPADVAGIP